MSDIRIDEPGAGEWVMERAHGFFRPGVDHSFTSHDGNEILGGFAMTGYIGGSMSIHMAAQSPHWCSRELLWLPFHYGFEQLKLRKMFAPVRSDNYAAISENLRAGWIIEAVLSDAFDTAHMFVLSMTRDTCPWLAYEPKHWRSGGSMAYYATSTTVVNPQGVGE